MPTLSSLVIYGMRRYFSNESNLFSLGEVLVGEVSVTAAIVLGPFNTAHSMTGEETSADLCK